MRNLDGSTTDTLQTVSEARCEVPPRRTHLHSRCDAANSPKTSQSQLKIGHRLARDEL